MPNQTIVQSKPAGIWETAPGRAVHAASQAIQNGVTKVLDFVLPRNPVTKRREFRFVPVFVENYLGTSLFDSACPKSKICKDEALVAKVDAIFKKVVAQCDRKDLNYEIRVMEDDQTVNAFCAPGGKVIISTALLKALERSVPGTEAFGDVSLEDKIAAVLGHEITHAAAGHGARRMQVGLLIALVGRISSFVIPRLVFQRKQDESDLSHEMKVGALEFVMDIVWRVGSFFFMQQRSRSHEFEADKYGIKYAAKAGYRPEGALWIQSLLFELEKEKKSEKEGFGEYLHSHPNSDKRLEANKKIVEKIHCEGIERAFN